MADLIRLLPDAIANQIAAGEVVQRPASVVKELMENAIDAGSSQIRLIVKDAGKSLIQVVDNGCGMSETDARMCFERHATSKIREAVDLFNIRTMGFRGEALASIAAVAQVELKTRRQSDELGTRLVVEGSAIRAQEACQCATGSSFTVKNLFFNIPARRNFLKSNPVEMRHLLDEFLRVALAHPDVFFSLHHNDEELYHLPPGNPRQRVVGILGKTANDKLVPVSEETDALSVAGFVGKPAFTRKTRGEQFFFVNRRFIKSSYLHHAVMNAYEGLLPDDAQPFYALFLDIDPARIDINVHPTKQEIKFDDEKLVYHYLRVAVRHALGQHNVTPMLDFEQETSFTPTAVHQHLYSDARKPASPSGTTPTGPEKAPRDQPSSTHGSNLRNWQKLYEGLAIFDDREPAEHPAPVEQERDNTVTIESAWPTGQEEMDDTAQSFSKLRKEPYQIHGTYIVSHIKSGFLLIDQQAAHERILYEQYLLSLHENKGVVQQQLFPRTLSLSTADAALLQGILPEINHLGFDIREFGRDTFIIHGIPADFVHLTNEQAVVETLLEQYKTNTGLQLPARESLARSLARGAAIRRGQSLTIQEMQDLIDRLFACEVPYKSPSGQLCFITWDLEELKKRFG